MGYDAVMDKYFDANRKHWDELVPIHERSEMYDVAAFRHGQVRLHPLEVEEVGDVAGKTMLHLQCHFGLDTLSWASLGAIGTGIDFSPTAVATAQRLSEETGVPARFIESDVYGLPDVLHEQFDIVFTSYGAIIWLPDIRRWAEVVAHFVKPGGFFYIAEGHPLANTFDNDPGVTELRMRWPYFAREEPLTFSDQGSYADADAVLKNPTSHEWNHGLGEVVTSLIDAGLRIDYLHEHPFCAWQMFPFMEKGNDRNWRLTKHAESLPLLYSIKATKP